MPNLSDDFMEVVRKVLANGGYKHLDNANAVVRMLLDEVERLQHPEKNRSGRCECVDCLRRGVIE